MIAKKNRATRLLRSCSLEFCLISALMAAPQALAQTPAPAPPLLDLFSHTARVIPADDITGLQAGELVRLPLSAEVVSHCARDFSDLRISAGGQFLPYVIDSNRDWSGRVQEFESRVIGVESERLDRSLVGDGPSRIRETMQLAAPPRSGNWQLVASSERATFTRTVEIWQGDPDSDGVLLVAGSSIFRLQEPLREGLRIPVGAIERDSGPITVILEGDEPALQPEWRWILPIAQTAGTRPAPSSFPLARKSGTANRFERPSAVLPDALRLRTDEALFHAHVRVWEDDPSAGGSRLLGGATIFRTGKGGNENLDVPLSALPQSRTLRLVFDGENETPGFAYQLEAVAATPDLVFAWPAGADDGGEPMLLFGGARIRAPESGLDDLSRLLAVPRAGQPQPRVLARETRAQILLDLRSIEASAQAIDVRENPNYQSQPRLGDLLAAGAELAPSAFSHRRQLVVEASADGLSELRLSPGDLAVLRADQGDLRFLDENNRQRPYRLLHSAELDLLRQAVELSQQTEGGVSTLELEAAWSPLPVGAIELQASKPFFDRSATVTAVLASGEREEVYAGRLRKQADDPTIHLDWTPRRVRRLEVAIENGDDAPIPFERAWFIIPSRRAQLIAPAGSYSMLLGDPDLESPRYEALRASELLLENLRLGEVRLFDLESNPAYRATSRLTGALSSPKPWFWMLLVVAVVFLAMLTMRSLGGDPESDAS